MKNAFWSGIIIGVLSGLWLLFTSLMGYHSVKDNNLAPIDYFSVLIPLLGLYFGVKSYKAHEMDGTISFIEALIQGLKILFVGGIIAAFAAIVYVNYATGGLQNIADFSGRIFGALLVGIMFAIIVALAQMNKSTHL